MLGLADGKPAASAAVLMVEGYRYVALVATDPGQQRRGYADAVMRRALEIAATAHGERPTVLHATDAGRPVYERMGYAAISTHTIFMEQSLLGGHRPASARREHTRHAGRHRGDLRFRCGLVRDLGPNPVGLCASCPRSAHSPPSFWQARPLLRSGGEVGHVPREPDPAVDGGGEPVGAAGRRRAGCRAGRRAGWGAGRTGRQVYESTCTTCHGPDGKGGVNLELEKI